MSKTKRTRWDVSEENNETVRFIQTLHEVNTGHEISYNQLVKESLTAYMDLHKIKVAVPEETLLSFRKTRDDYIVNQKRKQHTEKS